jgi:hypothetical protein
MRIKCAAIHDRQGVIWEGKNHSDCYKNSYPNAKGAKQGFVTENGLFVGRIVAAEIAFKAGQIKKRKDCLFSEDLKNSDYVS